MIFWIKSRRKSRKKRQIKFKFFKFSKKIFFGHLWIFGIVKKIKLKKNFFQQTKCPKIYSAVNIRFFAILIEENEEEECFGLQIGPLISPAATAVFTNLLIQLATGGILSS